MAERYPAATWLGNGKSGGSYTGGPWRLVIHTTETRGVPGYNNGASAPHVTIDNDGRVYQHTSFLTAARALRNEAGGVQTNREQAIQVEIVCYSQKSLADKLDKGVWVAELPDVQWRAVVAFVQWVVEEFGVLPVVPERQAFDYAQANAPGFRMSNAEWDGFDAICGHQHVPENDHWDPGAFPWGQLAEEINDMAFTDKEEQRLKSIVEYIYDRNGSSAALFDVLIPKIREGLLTEANHKDQGSGGVDSELRKYLKEGPQ